MRQHERGGQNGRGTSSDREGDPLTRRDLVRRAGTMGVGLAGLPALLAACGGGESGGGAGAGASGASLEEPASKPAKIVMRTWGDPWQSTYADGPIQAFTQKTGIPVQVDTSDYTQMQSKVRAAVRAKRRPPVDLVLTIEPEAYLANVQKLSVPFDPSLLTNAGGLPAFAKPPGGALSYVNVVSYTFPLVYVKKRVTLPQDLSWNELWDPRFRGRVFVSNNPASLILPTAKMLGVDVVNDDLTPVYDKLRELRPNIAGVGDDEEFISLADRGQIDLGVNLAAVAAEVDGLAWRVPKEGQYLSFESLYVPRGLPAPETYYAQLLANEVLAAKAQSAIADGILEVPVNPDATLPERMKGDPAFPFTPQEFEQYGLVPSIEVLARKRESWTSSYNAAVSA